MQAHKIGRFSIVGAAAIAVLAVGVTTASARDYPPSETTPTTVIAEPPTTTVPAGGTVDVEVQPPVDQAVASTSPTPATGSDAVLPKTGGDSSGVVKVAGGAAIAGLALVLVGRRRRATTA
jgi:LPXTG-motif cell wall-anchored protein